SHQLHAFTPASAQDSRHLVAIYVGQTNINKHEVGLDALNEFDSCFTTTCRLHVVTEQLQCDDQRFSAIVMVLDDRDALTLQRLGLGLDGFHLHVSDEGEPHRNLCACTFAPYLYRAAVQFQDPLDHTQAKRARYRCELVVYC